MNENSERVDAIQVEIKKLRVELRDLQKKECRQVEKEYVFSSSNGDVSLTDLFGDQNDLILVHNMGADCPYCTAYADGINGVLHHLENRSAVAMLSPDSVSAHKDFAFSRGWKMKMLSTHEHGEDFNKEMGFWATDNNSEGVWPGFSCFHKEGDTITRTGFSYFDPGDEFCVLFPILELLKDGYKGWEPEFKY